MSKKRLDEKTGQTTTGHEYDGIEELNTPLPRWWLWTFYITIIWAVGYTIAYPAWPLISGATQGLLGYSTRTEVAESIKAHNDANADLVVQLLQVDLSDFAPQSDLHRYAVARGASVFQAQCSQCHGAGAAGTKGYPNLLDNDWLWGGTLPEITFSVQHGIRNVNDDAARYSQMPEFKEILTKKEIKTLANHVQNLATNGGSNAGNTLFEENCASCHGVKGLGDKEIGAPNLSDAIWLYGGDIDSITNSITYARFGVMPAWGQRLTEEDVRAVSTYVHSLGGGK